MKKWLWLSVLLNLTFMGWYAVDYYRHHEKHMQQHLTKEKGAAIVMFGDSHVEGGNWNLGLGRNDAKNKGYGGFTSDQLRFQLRTEVLPYHPKVCFLEGGGNDLGGKCFSVNSVVENYRIMIETLRQHNILPVVQSVFFQLDRPQHVASIDSINVQLRELSTEKSVAFIDVNAVIAHNKKLKAELTSDGIHLNEKGYELWYGLVNEYLQKSKWQ